ncbi:uncharacterized protein BDZ99DRAFT_460279 [Mytilinidion resinicola]|uniref:Membrane anchor Opy2 N-terminal domain-containing protein n=1 Tax=Mytilinidion resinicola TaxID=574789 RepID=A0A6A6YVW8_9PEZI|nr:uncharacterized protein BDZ99DRAFT_460279 [Mytilinidion resinicola]KAF2812951.1 hypothetical protein BDZ99DRAFT_460279 [Mytilinidion resinicola]
MSATIALASDATPYTATPSATQAACTWLGHCLGDPCVTENDCDNDWVCSNKICVPCCLTGAPTSTDTTIPTTAIATSSTTSSTSTSVPQRGLTKANIITIGVAGPVGVAVIAMAIYLIWRARRKRKGRQHAWNNPANTFGKAELDTTNPGAATSATKYPHELVVEEPPIEMPESTSPRDPDAIELVELEGDVSYQGKGDRRALPPHINEVYNPISDTEQPHLPLHRLSPRARRFEEVVSPDTVSLGQRRASPASDLSSSRPIISPPQTYRRLDDDDVEEPVFDSRSGSDSSYTLFRWPTERSPERRGHG